MDKVKRPILRYHGGKWKLAPWIISHFPKHKIYTEVYGGGGSVLMQKKRSYAEVYNDKWDKVVNVFNVLRDTEKSEQLEKLLRLTPFSRTEFTDTDNIQNENEIETARKTIFRSFAGFGSAATNDNYSTGFRCNSNRSGSTPAHDWANYPNMISKFTNRLKGVVIENRNAIDVLKQHDGLETLHYVDPPYVHSTRNIRRKNASYVYEMTDEDHKELRDCLFSLKGMIILSGYRCELYDNLYSEWKCVEKATLADGARKRIECLWLNQLAQISQLQTEFNFQNKVLINSDY